ncbi:MAG: hypothetical protein RSF67_10105 [Clostridia bacterium]
MKINLKDIELLKEILNELSTDINKGFLTSSNKKDKIFEEKKLDISCTKEYKDVMILFLITSYYLNNMKKTDITSLDKVDFQILSILSSEYSSNETLKQVKQNEEILNRIIEVFLTSSKYINIYNTSLEEKTIKELLRINPYLITSTFINEDNLYLNEEEKIVLDIRQMKMSSIKQSCEEGVYIDDEISSKEIFRIKVLKYLSSKKDMNELYYIIKLMLKLSLEVIDNSYVVTLNSNEKQIKEIMASSLDINSKINKIISNEELLDTIFEDIVIYSPNIIKSQEKILKFKNNAQN